MRLTTITANRHVFNGLVHATPLRLLLTFQDGRTLRLGVAGDGSTIAVDSRPLDEPSDLGDYGSVVVEDVTQSIFARLHDTEVLSVRALQQEGRQVGVCLQLGSGDAFHFWVDDDEFFWGDDGALAAHHWLDGLIPTAGKTVQV